jgi:hypothetical protein
LKAALIKGGRARQAFSRVARPALTQSADTYSCWTREEEPVVQFTARRRVSCNIPIVRFTQNRMAKHGRLNLRFHDHEMPVRCAVPSRKEEQGATNRTNHGNEMTE